MTGTCTLCKGTGNDRFGDDNTVTFEVDPREETMALGWWQEGCTWLVMAPWRAVISYIIFSSLWKSSSWYSNRLPKMREQMTFATPLVTLSWGLKGFPEAEKDQFSSTLLRKEENTYQR